MNMLNTALDRTVSAITGTDPMTRANDQMSRVLKAFADLDPKPIEECSPTEARRQPSAADAVKKVMQEDGIAMPRYDLKVIDTTIQGAAGQLQARIYQPNTATAALATGNLPVVVYLHGGGWVIADLDVYDAGPRALAQDTQALVIAVHYRQGPEHKFPDAHNDAFAAYKWALENAAGLGGDPTRVAVMGESAGGNMAAAVAMMARDNGVQLPVHQVLVYPVAGTDLSASSVSENAYAKPLNRSMLTWFMGHYLRDDNDKKSPLMNQVEANLQGLPDTTVILAEIDPLRSGGEMLADKLKDAGVTVTSRTYAGVTHEFYGMGTVLKEARDAQLLAATELKKAFSR